MSITVLMITDDSNTAYLLRRYAEESGLQTLHAATVAEAVPLIAAALPAVPAVLILEQKSATGPEQEALQALQAHPLAGRLPLIVYRWNENSLPDLDPHVSGYLHRPLLLKEFVAVLRRAGIPAAEPRSLFSELPQSR